MKTFFKSYIVVILILCIFNSGLAIMPQRDTEEGILYAVVEEQYPLGGLTVSAKNPADIISRMIMFNQLEQSFKAKILLNQKIPEGKETYQAQLDIIKTNLTKKIEEAIKELITADMVKVIKKRTTAFQEKGIESGILAGVKNIFWNKPRKKIARTFGDKKAREDYADAVYFQINPADTQEKIGTNNIAALYEELFELIQVSRKVGDLITAYIFLAGKDVESFFMQTAIKSINTARDALFATLTSYIKDLSGTSVPTKDTLLFFAQMYQQESSAIILGIQEYLTTVADRKITRHILSDKNRKNLYQSTLFPVAFDEKSREAMQKLYKDINVLRTENYQYIEKIKQLERKKSALESKIFSLELEKSVPEKKAEKTIKKELEAKTTEKAKTTEDIKSEKSTFKVTPANEETLKKTEEKISKIKVEKLNLPKEQSRAYSLGEL